MIATILFGLTSVLWGMAGVILTVLPRLWVSLTRRLLTDAWSRFWVTQGMILVGLVLTIGTQQFQGVWLWMLCGLILTGKACFLLGSTEPVRARLMRVVEHSPLWVYRCWGGVMVLLTIFFTTDMILHGLSGR